MSPAFRSALALFVAVALMGVVSIVLFASAPQPDVRVEAQRSTAPASVPASPGNPSTLPPDTKLAATPSGATAAGEPGTPQAQPRPRNRMARDLEREQIWSALAREHELEPAAAGSAAPTPEAAANLPSLDPQYIKSALAEQLVPVMSECYESAIEDDPKLAGTLVVEFTIVGAEEVGGIVEDANITDESTLDSPFVRECMRESLLAVTFEPPSDGGRVEITFPIRFAPDAPANE